MPQFQFQLRRLALVLFWLLALVLPLSVNTEMGLGGITLLLPAEPLAGLLTLLFLAAAVSKWRREGISLLFSDRILILFGLALLPGLCFAEYPLVSLKYVVSVTAWMAVGYGLPRILQFTRSEWMRAAYCLLASTLVLCLWVVRGILQEGISHESSYITAQPFVPQGHTNLTAMVEPLFIIVIAALFWVRSRKGLIGWLAAAMLLFAIIDYSWSRSAFITSSLTLVLFIGFAGHRHRKKLLWMLLIAVMVPVGMRKVYEMVFEKYYRIHSFYDPRNPLTRRVNSIFSLMNPYSDLEKNSMNERLARWKFAAHIFGNHPLTGIGPGCFPEYNQTRVLEELKHNKSKPLTWHTLRKMNTHNLWISWMCEGGLFLLVAGLLLCSTIIAALWRMRLLKKGWSLGAGAFKLALMAYFIHFFIQAVFQDFQNEPRVILIFWAACALLLPLSGGKRKVPRIAGHS